MYTDVKSFSDLHNEVVLPNINKVTGQVTSTYNTWKGNVDKVFKEAGISVENFGKLYAEVIGNKDEGTGIEGKTNELSKALTGLGKDASDGFSGIVNAATTQYDNFSTKIDEYKTKLDELLPQLDEFLQKVGLAKDAEIPGVEDTEGPPPPPPPQLGKVFTFGGYYNDEGKLIDAV
jgi:hypothetical protein